MPDVRPYLNSWVALLRGRVIGVGSTSEAAYLAAKACCPHEEPSSVQFVAPTGHAGNPQTSLDPYASPKSLSNRMGEFFRRHELAGVVRSALLDHAGGYLVGGAVRDVLVGRATCDLDFVVSAGAWEVARGLADALEGAAYLLDDTRGTARIVLKLSKAPPLTIDVATMRGANIEEDLSHRDFTINAMAVSLSDMELIDPLEGYRDLARRQLRLTQPEAISADPIRAVRAARLLAQFDLQMDAEVEKRISRDAFGLKAVSWERVRDELVKILTLPNSAAAVRELVRLDLMAHLFPELSSVQGGKPSAPFQQDVWERSLLTLGHVDRLLMGLLPETKAAEGDLGGSLFAGDDLLSGDTGVNSLWQIRPALRKHLQTYLADYRPRWLIMKLAALLHDLGRPLCRMVDGSAGFRFSKHEIAGARLGREVACRLRFSSSEADLLERIIRFRRRPLWLAQAGEMTNRACHRFFRDVGSAGIEIALLVLVDTLAVSPPPDTESHQKQVRRAALQLVYYWLREQGPEQTPPLLDGRAVMDILTIEGGPDVGRVLRCIREKQVSGELSTKEEAESWLRSSSLARQVRRSDDR